MTVPIHALLVEDDDRMRLALTVSLGAARKRIAGCHAVSRGRVALRDAVRRDAGDAPVSLTARERQLLTRLARGCTYEKCARMLGIGLGTVHGYVKLLYRRLDVFSKADASAMAVKLGLVDED